MPTVRNRKGMMDFFFVFFWVMSHFLVCITTESSSVVQNIPWAAFCNLLLWQVTMAQKRPSLSCSLVVVCARRSPVPLRWKQWNAKQERDWFTHFPYCRYFERGNKDSVIVCTGDKKNSYSKFWVTLSSDAATLWEVKNKEKGAGKESHAITARCLQGPCVTSWLLSTRTRVYKNFYLMHMHHISYAVNSILALRKDLCALIKLKPVIFLRFQSLRRSLFMSDVDQLKIQRVFVTLYQIRGHLVSPEM